MHEAILTALAEGRPIIGIDEVGRGAWAGPVVAGAVLLAPNLSLQGVRDSKVMTPRGRHTADRLIRASATAIGLGWVSAGEVDQGGLSRAVQTSGIRALDNLRSQYDVAAPLIILDGSSNYLQDTVYDSVAIVKADGSIPTVSAASVVAKVARDRYLELLDRRYPGYGFAQHKGYGVALHVVALARLGVSPEHRRSYRPIQRFEGATQ